MNDSDASFHAPFCRTYTSVTMKGLTRTQPDFVLRLCAEWARSTNPHTRWIVRDGLRKMKTMRPAEAERILKLVAASE